MISKLAICLLCSILLPKISLGQDIIYQRLALADSYRQQLDYNSAIDIYKSILEERYVEEANESLSSIYYQQQMYAELHPLLVSALANAKPNQKRVVLISTLGELKMRNGDAKTADSLWTEALELYPLSMETYSTVAAAQLRSSEIDRAYQTYLLGNDNLKGTLFSDKILKILVTKRDYKAAMPIILEELDDTKNINNSIGKLYPFIAISQESEQYIGEILKSKHENSDNLLYSELYKWYLNTTGDMNAALEVAVKLDELKNTGGRELNSFANQMIQDGKFDVAIKAFQILMQHGEGHKFYNSAQYGFASATQRKMESGNDFSVESAEEVIDIYLKIIEKENRDNITALATYRVARLYYEPIGKLDLAKKYLVQLNELFSPTYDNFLGQLLLAEIHIKAREFQEAKDVYYPLPKKFKRITKPNDLNNISFQLALISIFEKDFKSTGTLLSKSISNSSLDITNDAIELNQLLSSTSDTSRLVQLSTGLFHEYVGNQKAAIDSYTKMIGQGDKLDEELMYRVAELYFENGSYTKAIDYCEQIKSKDVLSPLAERALYLKAKSLYEKGELEQSLDSYKRFMMDYPNSIKIADVRSSARMLQKNIK